MNTFGKLFRITIIGKSHGEIVGVVIDGCPSGLPLSLEDFKEDLKRRMPDLKGVTQRKEEDVPLIKSGLYRGRTDGSPLVILFENKDVSSKSYEDLEHLPRPGHADFVAYKKYGGFNDPRGGGQFSGRLTVAICAAGVVAKKLIKPTTVHAELIEVGGRKDFIAAIEEAESVGDTLGGIVECTIKNVPPGLGEPFFDSFESLISHMVFSIPGVKGIEFGCGFDSSRMKGSEYNDEIISIDGKTKTNHSGGIQGGITNGNDVILRVVVRPTPSIRKKQWTLDLRTGQRTEIEIKGRHDTCFAIRIPVILEAACSIVLADLMLMEQKIRRVWHERG
ncbi:MAG: chorismate synthase [Desulfobacterota bacterium]|nr:chorismate synthase [Thermodesulfobacteriota bacterium]MDW8002715.1 chorismate synthase [Deltaproteobacteria bacterium]